ncbi:phage tail protein [Moraxella bovis]|uniref:TipJ family phage tail tip protein n=1 Tax=Moraxella bovis TaxID=476 RepID=UPI002227EC8B|nr:phage tail protein [Moraxella bovis]UZA44236.1 phage tail protein [Moraxella bovis]
MIHGAKKKQPQPHRPHIAKDDLVSVERYQGLYGLCEGEIFGLADGGRSIRLDGTPIINASGQANFTDVSWEFRTGTNDQSYIKGFASVENETAVGVELRHDRPFVRAINNKDLSAVRVRLNFNALRQQHDNGDITGYGIEYAVDVQTDGGAFVQMLRTSARGKASSGFKRSHRIDLPKGKTWTIRVRRITPNRNSDLIADTMYIDALTEIIDAKLRYPNTALLALTYNAKTFSNIAKIAVRLKGKLIQVPSNYDPTARTYFGLWDGQFKMAYSNNPAWVFYDLCTHKRYGLGERLNGMVDKWRLYQIAQYCDEMVDDGKGGREPRFAINVYIQKADDAYRVLQNIASVFRGLSFWDGSQIVLDSDTPKDPVYTFSPANIVGEFVYQGTRSRDRHTVAKVAWDNPEHDYATEYEMVREESAIAKYGIRTLDINAFGCTSRGQAQRAGLWALKAEQLETRTVNFKTGLMGFIPQVGQIINIADNLFAGRAVSGRILSVNDTQITLDRTAGKVGDTLTINTDGTVKTAKIVSVHGDTLTVDTAVGQADDVWAIISDDLKLMQFRVLSIAQNDDATFDITALQYEHQKYDVVDNGAVVTPQPYTVLKATPIHAPKTVTITANTRTHQGQAITTLTINWEQVQGAAAYIVEWRKDDGNWQTMPKVAGQSVDIDGVYGGAYMARVRAVDSFDGESLATSSQLTAIAGKVGRPPRLANLTVQGILFGMNLGWSFNKGSEDTNFTEIEVSPDGRSNITTLGTFAYPTNKHEITGLQGNLTQFYRGRIVDKLGNTSDWTAWASGTTSGDAGKVLDLISGQINGSHLDQTLRTPIAKIGDLQTAVDGVNAQLPTLNSQLATANRELQTAISNITTERNRITSAIRDITALQADKNAKTQEIANLTQTMNGHTSSIRELGVTTGDLSQKYTQIKTQADNATSEITTIKQTQTGQASSIDRLGARFDNLTVGGRNLLLNTQALNPLWTRPTSIENGVATFVATGRLLASTQQSDNVQALENGKVTISFTAKSNRDGRLHIRLRRFNTNNQLSDIAQYIAIDSREFKRYSLTLDYSKWTNQERVNFEIATYERAGFVCEVKLPKLEIGTIPTDWTPAPEDLQADIDAKASSASLDEFKRTQAQKDTATAQKLSTLQTTVNGQTTSIRNVERSVDGVRAIKAVTVDNNGVISGYGLMSELQNGRVTSQFGVNADSFFVGSPRNGKKPFATYTQPTVINGVRIPAGTYINTAFIANASITMAKIADSIQSDNYVAGRQGWRLFKDGRFELNNTFGDGSSLELNSKGLIVWYDKARGKKAVELGIFT